MMKRIKKIPIDKVLAVYQIVSKFLKRNKWRLFVILYFSLHMVMAAIYAPIPVALVAIHEAAVFSWLFVILYAFVDWYNTAIGFQLMSMSLFIAALTTASIIPIHGATIEWLSVVLLTAMPIISLNMVRLLMKVQRLAWYKREPDPLTET